MVDVGRSVSLFRTVAMSRRAFLFLSPVCRDGVVDVGGEVRIVIISVAACFRKSSIFISGNGTDAGKKVTVLTSLSLLVFGKNWKKTFHASIMVKRWSNVPAFFPMHFPSSLFGCLIMCYYFCVLRYYLCCTVVGFSKHISICGKFLVDH